MQLIVIGVGGAIGALARYLLGGAVHRLMPGFFPYGTFVVNLVGCIAFGVIVGIAEARIAIGPLGRGFLLIGVLGGFTTFSSFTYETFELMRSGQIWPAAVNVVGQVGLGFLGLWAGFGLGRAA
jgi:fluoride exporter